MARIRTGFCLDMTSRAARSMGSRCGYLACMSAMAAQQVCTDCVCSCSTQRLCSQDYAMRQPHLSLLPMHRLPRTL